MLRANLVSSISSPDVVALLPIPKAQKLLTLNQNSDIQVYFRENIEYKHFQTYQNILKSLSTKESVIENLYYSHTIGTIFAKCSKTIFLLNSTNLSYYDQVVDERGIDACWVFEVKNSRNERGDTLFLYSIKGSNKFKILVWEERVYKEIHEFRLPKKSDTVLSVEVRGDLIIFCTRAGIYTWSYKKNVVVKVNKIVKRKFPTNLIFALKDFEHLYAKYNSKEPLNDLDDQVSVFSSRLSKKSSISNFWLKKITTTNSVLSQCRYIFHDVSKKNYVIFDGFTKSLFKLQFDQSDNEPYMVTYELNELMDWNHGFKNLFYCDLNLLVVYNSNTVKFIDPYIGFEFSTIEVENEINNVVHLGGPHFVIYTKNGDLHHYHCQVDDGMENLSIENDSIFGEHHDSDFYQLWRKVRFYRFFLTSDNAKYLCASPNYEDSLDLCAMKLRDLTVLLCLRVFERYVKCTQTSNKQWYADPKFQILQNTIIKSIYQNFIQFWAPPQLVISKTFPTYIASKVLKNTIFEQYRSTDIVGANIPKDYLKDLVTKWYLPYLTDVRRNLKNLLKPENSEHITWEYEGRKISQTIEFFYMDGHKDLKISSLLQIIDNTMLQLYIEFQPGLLGPLLRTPNYCHFSFVEKELKQKDLFKELIDFYYQRQEHEKALKFLQELYSAEQISDIEKVQNGIILLAIDYLKRIPGEYLDVLFKYSKWVLPKANYDREFIQEIFFDESYICRNRDHKQVVKFLDDLNEVYGQEYLEFIISKAFVIKKSFANDLISRYLKTIERKEIRVKVEAILESTKSYEADYVLNLLKKKEETTGLSDKDHQFLSYLSVFPLKILGKHSQSIEILILKLDNYTAASRYCSKICISNPKEAQNILNIFFDAIIKSHLVSTYVPIFLQEFLGYLDSSYIYNRIPKTMTVSEMRASLNQKLKTNSFKKSRTELTKSLLQVELVNTSYLVNKFSSKHVNVKENGTCFYCKKKFISYSIDSVLLININDKDFVVHNNCGKNWLANRGSR